MVLAHMWAQAAFGSAYFLLLGRLILFTYFFSDLSHPSLLPPRLVLDFLLVKCYGQSEHHGAPYGLGTMWAGQQLTGASHSVF